MKKQPFANIMLAGMSLTEFGLKIPSPFISLELNNSEVATATSFTLMCRLGGDAKSNRHIAAFELLLYSAAQSAINSNRSGIPIDFAFGWLDEKGNVEEYLSYTGFSIKFSVSTDGQSMMYTITGMASLAMQVSMPVLHIPQLSGIVQPSAVVEAIAIASKATTYYELDIDHCDLPTYVSHGALTTSFNKYVRGTRSGKDNYQDFSGLLPLSKSYSYTNDAAGLKPQYKKLGSVLNNATVTPINEFLRPSIVDQTPQTSTFSYWVESPTMTSPGVIHYKSNAGLSVLHMNDTLEYGTANTNILSLSGSYNGVAYNMTDFNFSNVGFTLDGSGNTIVQDATVVNSWSSSLANVYQSSNIINDVKAIASQFTGDFTVTIPGSTKQYDVAEPVSLLVVTGNTLNPITGVYNIMSVSHTISNSFITTLKLQRLVVSTANSTASGQAITVNGSANYPTSSIRKTSNIKSTGKVDFGEIYPTFEDMDVLM